LPKLRVDICGGWMRRLGEEAGRGGWARRLGEEAASLSIETHSFAEEGARGSPAREQQV
jgi:hypothetical protein